MAFILVGFYPTSKPPFSATTTMLSVRPSANRDEKSTIRRHFHLFRWLSQILKLESGLFQHT